jgi:uncharacterized protein
MTPGSNSLAIDTPVAETERLEAIDLLRGVAVLGILLVNMQWFAMPNAAAVNPYALGQPSVTDLTIWSAIELFAESKFISVFSLLFGAGVVLMTGRLEHRGVSPGRVHYRRMMWLLIFGLVHAYVLWHGDILVLYAICGMLLYPFRRLSVRTLATLGVAAMAVGMLSSLAGQLSWPSWSDEVRGEWLTYWQPSTSAIAAETAAFKGGWLAQEPWRAGFAAEFHVQDMLFFDLWHVGGLMLLGMALLKSDVLTGRKTRGHYALQSAIGLACGLPLVAWGLYQFQAVDWRLPDSLFIIPLWNYWGSVFVALGYIGVLLTIWKAGVLRGVVLRLASVGRTAFSCYILETLVCTTIFYGHGLGLFGAVDRLQQLILTVVVWIVLLVLAPIWLHRFRYGPLEWLWRTLTYGHRVPMRRDAHKPVITP